MVLIKLEHSMRLEAKKLKDLKDERMKEVLKLRMQDEELCQQYHCTHPLPDGRLEGTHQVDGG